MEEIKLKQEIVELDIDSIKPYDGSHKTESNINLLIESIKDFGINQPITIDKNNVIVTGNGVWKAAKAAGLTKIPCIVLDDLSDEQIKQYRIADDKTQEFATWNEKKLRKELSYLQDPSSMQMYFDQDILGMLGLNMKVKQEKKDEKQESQEVSGIVNSMTKHTPADEVKDKRFQEEIKVAERSMEVSAIDTIEYVCSKCGRTVKIRR